MERARRWRHVVRLDVRSASRAMTFLAPFDTPATRRSSLRPVRARRQEGLARLAGALAGERRLRDLPTAVRAGVRLWPYQLEPALAMLAGQRRVLLADEVGLGKTIQAALAIAEMRHREPAARILIITPASVRDQWRDELLERFGIDALIADQQRLDALGRALAYGDSPWQRCGVWLTSADFIKQPHVRESLPLAPFDLIVIDEAHDNVGDSDRHSACAWLSRRARRLLLLTATPHSGDPARFDRLMALGAVDHEPHGPLVFRRTRQDLGIAGGRRIRWLTVRPDRTHASLLDALLEYEARVLAASRDRRCEDAARLLLAVLRKRALSTAHAFRRSVERRFDLLSRAPGGAAPDWLQPGLAFDGADHLDGEDTRALAADVGLANGHERSWLRRLRGLAAAAERRDRVPAAIAALACRSGEPAIVFTEFRDSLEAIARALNGVRAAVLLHGGLGAAERAAALRRFNAGGAKVLIATDVASQGLNLHYRCRWVIHTELPWTPVRLEQRVGRVDRVGQTRAVHVTLLRRGHPAEHGVLVALARRVLAARQSLGADALAAGLPDDGSIRRAIFSGADAEAPIEPVRPIDLSRRWRRPAVVLARSLARRRRLAGRWRVRPATGSRPRWFASGPLCASAATDGTFAVCSVPLLDARGVVVERHAVAVRCPERETGRSCPAPGELDRIAGRRLAARARRLERLLRADVERRARVERALERIAAGASPRRLEQAGLFDRRAEVAAARAAAEVDRLADGMRTRLEDLQRAARVTIGPVRVHAIVTRRRR